MSREDEIMRALPVIDLMPEQADEAERIGEVALSREVPHVG